MFFIRLHMSVMPIEKKKELSEIYSHFIFPNQGNVKNDIQWNKHWGIIFVTMTDREHLLRNIWFAMIQEILGLGPSKYCIVSTGVPKFESKLLLS